MDPETVANLEDAIRGLANTIGQSNDALAKQMGTLGSSLRDVAAGASSNARAQNAAAVSATALSDIEKQRKIEDEAAAASTKRFNSAVSEGKDALRSFAGAMLDVTPGIAKYASSINSATSAASNLAAGLGPLGMAAGLLLKAFGGLAGAALKYQDALVSGFDDMAKVGGGVSLTAERIGQLGTASGFTSQNLGIFTKHMASASSELVSMGGSVSKGTEMYGKLTAIGDQQIMKYRKLGMTQEEVIDAQNVYIRQQAESGASLKKTPEQLKKASLEYIDQLNVLAELTGQDVKTQQKAQDWANSNQNYNAYKASQQRKADDLAAAAEKEKDPLRKKELQAQSDHIKSVLKNKDELANQAAKIGGEQGTAMLEAISTDGATIMTKNIARQEAAGIHLSKINDNLNKGENQTGEFLKQNAKSVRDFDTQFGQMGYAAGAASRSLQEARGQTNEGRALAAKYDKMDQATWEKEKAAAEAKIAAKGVIDKQEADLMAQTALREKAERDARKAFDELLKSLASLMQGLIMKVLPMLTKGLEFVVTHFDKVVLAAKALAIALGTVMAAAAIGKGAQIVGGVKEMFTGKLGTTKQKPLYVEVVGGSTGDKAKDAVKDAVTGKVNKLKDKAKDAAQAKADELKDAAKEKAKSKLRDAAGKFIKAPPAGPAAAAGGAGGKALGGIGKIAGGAGASAGLMGMVEALAAAGAQAPLVALGGTAIAAVIIQIGAAIAIGGEIGRAHV